MCQSCPDHDRWCRHSQTLTTARCALVSACPAAAKLQNSHPTTYVVLGRAGIDNAQIGKLSCPIQLLNTKSKAKQQTVA
jgi:hypothetical protein